MFADSSIPSSVAQGKVAFLVYKRRCSEPCSVLRASIHKYRGKVVSHKAMRCDAAASEMATHHDKIFGVMSYCTASHYLHGSPKERDAPRSLTLLPSFLQIHTYMCMQIGR